MIRQKSYLTDVPISEEARAWRFPFSSLLLWGTAFGVLNLLLGLAMQRALAHFSNASFNDQRHITLLLGVFTVSLFLALLPSAMAGYIVSSHVDTSVLSTGGIAGMWCSFVATLLSVPANQIFHRGASWSDILILLVVQLFIGFLVGVLGSRFRSWQKHWSLELSSEYVLVERADSAETVSFAEQGSLLRRSWRRWQNWWTRRDVCTALAATLLLRIFCSLTALLANNIAPGPYILAGEVPLRYIRTFVHTPPPFTVVGWINYLGAGWRQWDTGWDTGIAGVGYTGHGMTAFLPLYPLLMHLIGPILLGDNLTFAGLLISTVCCFYVFLSVYRIAEHLSTVPGAARRMVFLAAVLPVSFFLVAGYTEALFLWATFGAMLAFFNRQWGRMALFGVIASLTRHQGPLLSLLLVPTVLGMCRSWLSERWGIGRVVRELWGPLLAALAGPAVYVGWAFFVVQGLHQPLPWVSLQQWHLHFSVPGTGIFADIIALAHPGRPSSMGLPGDTLDAGAALLSAVVIILAFRRVPPALTIFAVGIWCVALFKVEPDGETMSAARYLLPLLPMSIVVVERLVRSRPVVQLAWMVLGCLTVFFCTWYFILGLWVN